MSTNHEPYDSLIECPLCRDEGVVSSSGRVPHLFVNLDRDLPMSCPGVHGQIPADVLRAHGIPAVPAGDPGSGLAPSAARDAVADAPDRARQDAPREAPDDLCDDEVSDLEQESAYRDSPTGDVAQNDPAQNDPAQNDPAQNDPQADAG